MILVTNDADLRKYIPNVFSTVKGESSLFDKLAPWLESSELWFSDAVTGKETLEHIASLENGNLHKNLSCSIVVYDALRLAVPSLDLVLTPNGFGIVSNSNVAPASKERVDRLVASLETNRDITLEQLLNILPALPLWSKSDRYAWFKATLFPNISLCSLMGVNQHKWSKYLELRTQVVAIEDSLAEDYLSHELLRSLREMVISNSANDSCALVIDRITAQIIGVLKGNPVNSTAMMNIVNYIRYNPELFPEWHASQTAKIFSPPVFSNEKKSSGYWF